MSRPVTFGLCVILLGNAPSHTAPITVTDQAVQAARETGRGEVGLATFYAREFDGRKTASGLRFDNDELLAAHPTLPFGTVVRVTNLMNDQSVEVEIVDRGPAGGPRANGVIIDLSRAAADALDFVKEGRTRVRVDVPVLPGSALSNH